MASATTADPPAWGGDAAGRQQQTQGFERREVARNPYAREIPEWRPHATGIRNKEVVRKFSPANKWRLSVLLDIASEAETRWIIEESMETLVSALEFSNEVQCAGFLASLVGDGLLLALEDGRFVPSPDLCPTVKDFPSVPTLKQSVANVSTFVLENRIAERKLRGAMTTAQRQALSREWKEYEEALHAAGVAMPPSEDKEAYKQAREAFAGPFLELYKGGMTPERALEEMLTRFEREQHLRDISGQAHADVTENVTNKIVTFGPELKVVTIAQTTDLESENESEELDKETNNNSFSKMSHSDSGEMSRNGHRDIVTSDLPDEERKTVVVLFLSETGVAVPGGQIVRIGRDVAAEFVNTWRAQGQAWDQINARVQRQAVNLPFRKQDPAQGTWSGLFRSALDRNYPDEQGLLDFEKKQEQVVMQEVRRREKEIQRQQAAAADQQAARITQELWASKSAAEQDVLIERAAQRLGAWLDKWKEHKKTGKALSSLACNALNGYIEDVLRAEAALPPRGSSIEPPKRFPREETNG